MLAAQFPTLAGSSQSLAKWWALQIARFATSDKWQGMSIAETAQVLGRSEGAIKQLQLRGVRNLAKLMPEGLR